MGAVKQMTPFPPEGVDTGATNTPNPDPSAIPSGNVGSGRLKAEVTRALGNAGVSPFEIEDFRIEDVADRLHRAGFRLVSDDEATVERVAAKIWGSGVLSGWSLDMEHYRVMARAAVRALLGEDRDA